MKIIKMLKDEHALIRQFIDNLFLAQERMELGTNPPRAFFVLALDFARTYIDKHHHFKEEFLMFGRLAQKMNGEADQYVDALRRQHETGRTFLSKINGALDGYHEGKPTQVIEVSENLMAFAALLRHHIHVEDHLFYPLTEKMLSDADDYELFRSFLEEETKNGGEEFIERAKASVQQLGLMLASMS